MVTEFRYLSYLSSCERDGARSEGDKCLAGTSPRAGHVVQAQQRACTPACQASRRWQCAALESEATCSSHRTCWPQPSPGQALAASRAMQRPT
eukprot:scaffold17815_cov112-Isochrysis_galbana.AAC.9